MKKRIRASSSIGVSASPMRKSRIAASPSEVLPLSHFRQLTQHPPRRPLRHFTELRPSTQIKKLQRSLMPRARLSVANFDFLKICNDRKTRRRVIFASKKAGGSHRPPKFRLKSLVRC